MNSGPQDVAPTDERWPWQEGYRFPTESGARGFLREYGRRMKVTFAVTLIAALAPLLIAIAIAVAAAAGLTQGPKPTPEPQPQGVSSVHRSATVNVDVDPSRTATMRDS